MERPSEDRRAFYIEHYLKDIRLLSHGDMARLFPDATVIRERWWGWTKSLIAVRAEIAERARPDGPGSKRTNTG
jgi:hypothetical protein